MEGECSKFLVSIVRPWDLGMMRQDAQDGPNKQKGHLSAIPHLSSGILAMNGGWIMNHFIPLLQAPVQSGPDERSSALGVSVCLS